MNVCLGNSYACGYRARQPYVDVSCYSALGEEDGWGLKSTQPSLVFLMAKLRLKLRFER